MAKSTKPISKAPEGKRVYISQAEIPKYSLEDCIKLGQALHDNFNGSAPPHELANALDISPTSSSWQFITGAAVAYGITVGAYNASEIKLGEIGRRIVAEEVEGDSLVAIREATLKPTIIKRFLEKYDRGKFPPEAIAMNVLASLGVPRERLKPVFAIIKSAATLSGFISETKSGFYVSLNVSKRATPVAPKATTENGTENQGETSEGSADEVKVVPESVVAPKNNRVFITHGKNHDILAQIKDLLAFGKFAPVVAVEHETLSKPVPDKVMEEMRSCFAGVIHVESEEELLDAKGVKHHKINENVLIEIGAAMALYHNNFVLLVQKGIHLPSNLQGLYCCFYEGAKLDYDATMKLLKAFSEFK
jgi:hypothetical protein